MPGHVQPLGLGGHKVVLTCSLGEVTGPGVSEDRDPVQMFSGTSGEALSDMGSGVSWKAGSPLVSQGKPAGVHWPNPPHVLTSS